VYLRSKIQPPSRNSCGSCLREARASAALLPIHLLPSATQLPQARHRLDLVVEEDAGLDRLGLDRSVGLGPAATAAVSDATHATAATKHILRENVNAAGRKDNPFYRRVRNYSAASLCPRRALSLWINSSAASAITVPGGKIASAPAL